jgi:hypothetical protein
MKKFLTIFIFAFFSISIYSQGLVAYYPFSGNADDLSGNNHNGVIIGNPQFVNDRDGNPNSALSFDGVDDWIEVNSSSLFPSDAITLCYWVNRDGNSITGLQNYISKENSFQSYIYADSTFKSGLWLGTAGQWSGYGSDDYVVSNLNEWIFYAFTWDDNSKTANVYINGSLDTTEIETNPNAFLRTSNNKMYLGRNGSSNVYHIKGYFDDIRIYDRVLSELEISELYDPNLSQGLVAYYPFSGNADDLSGNNHNGVIIGNPQFVNDRSGNPNSALSFDGVDDWIEVNSSSMFPSDAITLCYWVNRNGNNINGLQNYISKENSFQSYIYADSTFTSGLWLGTPGQWSGYTSGDYEVSNLNEWIFYAFTWDDNSKIFNVYVNDSLVNTNLETDPNAFLRTSNNKMYLGRNGSSNVYHIKGYFDDIRIYDRVLSESEILLLLTPVENEYDNTVATDFKLYQNYPNPFNPSTKISWQSPFSGYQSLKIFDVLGNEVATLVDEFRNAGSYEVEFNAYSLSSGIYFYQLKAGEYLQTKKMILIK